MGRSFQKYKSRNPGIPVFAILVPRGKYIVMSTVKTTSVYAYVIISILSLCSGLEALSQTNYDSAKYATIGFTLDENMGKYLCSDYRMTLLEEQLESARILIKTNHKICHVFSGNSEIGKVKLVTNSKYQVNITGKIQRGPNNYTMYVLPSTYGRDETNDDDICINNNKNIIMVNCKAEIHVRQKKNPLSVAINGVELMFDRQNVSVTDYDAVTHHKFKDGELADISCGKANEFGSLTIRYRDMIVNGYNSMQSRHDKKYILGFQVKLKSEHSGDYLICHIEHVDGDYTTVRVDFSLDDHHDDFFTIRVNGLKLRKHIENENTKEIEFFSYNVKKSELMTIVCGIRNDLEGTLIFKNEHFHGTLENGKASSIKTKISDEDLILFCNYNDNKYNKTAIITLKVNNEKEDFYILGIPPDNIQYQYTQYTQFYETVIQYQYSNYEVLKLSCVIKPPKPELFLYWDNRLFPGGSKYATQYTTSKYDKTMTQLGIITETVSLTSESNNTVVKCLVDKQMNVIFTISLRFMMTNTQDVTSTAPTKSTDLIVPTYPSQTSLDTIETTIDPIRPRLDNIETTTDPIRPHEPTKNWLITAIGSGICIILMILCFIVYSIHERQQNTRKKRSSGINYENLNHTPDSNIPNPIQWNEEYAQALDCRRDEDTYSVPINAHDSVDLYAKPQPKTLRINAKTKDIDNINDATYSEVSKLDDQDNETKYAQVVPKNLRNTMNAEENNYYANLSNTPNYAEVLPKSQRMKPSNGYPKIAPKPTTISSSKFSNIDKKSNDAKLALSRNNINKYDNVTLNNETYANVNTNTEYAEPAYCELNLKNNFK